MIQIQEVTFSYEDKSILQNFSMDLQDNNIYAITGPSSTGKSTFLRLICGLLRPDSGNILYDGKKVAKEDSNIFMMHQHYSNFPWLTCLENVLLPIRLHSNLTKADVDNAVLMIQNVDLRECLGKYPNELSGGMKQRLALARTLMVEPRVLLMDEPLSALDSVTRNKMQRLILDLHTRTKNLIVMVTHSEEEAARMATKRIRFEGSCKIKT